MKLAFKVVRLMLSTCEHKFQMLDEIIPFFDSGLYKYRGHADASWLLRTSLERLNDRLRVRMPEQHLQSIILETFRSSSELFFDWQPESELEWLSLIQHYGGPTCLLDFTDSFWVALYFAAWPHTKQGMDTDFSVLAIRNTCLPKGLVFHHPQRQNARLLAQQGLFLVKTDYEHSTDDILKAADINFESAEVIEDLDNAKRLLLPNIEASDGNRIAAIKFCFPRSSNRHVLEYLYKMNITGSSLYPDQEGAIQNLWNESHLCAKMISKGTGFAKLGMGLPSGANNRPNA